MAGHNFIFPDFGWTIRNQGGFLAFISFEFEGLIFTDWRLFYSERSGNPFVKAPAQRAMQNGEPKLDDNGRQVEYPYVRTAKMNGKPHPKGEAFFTALANAAYEEYQRRSASGGTAQQSRSRAKPAGSGMVNRGGKMDYEKMFPQDEDSELGW